MSSEIPPYRQRAGAVTIRELTAGLIWPELFRVLGLSVHPARVLMGTLTALVLFGGAKLPSLAKGLGQSIKEFKKATKEEEEAKSDASKKTPDDKV